MRRPDGGTAGEGGAIPAAWLNQRLRLLGEARPWSLSLGLVAVAVAGRAALAAVAPGCSYWSPLLAAVVMAGVFCPALPAATAAVAGAAVICVLHPAWFGWPLSDAAINALLFVPSAAVMLWATAFPRRDRRQRAAAEARLAEVFRQIPGAAAIIEAPNGRALLVSQMSDEILGHARRTVQSTDDMATHHGVHQDGRPYAANDYPIVRALRTGEVIRGEPLRYQRPDGFVELEVHAGPVRDQRGRIVAAVGMALDVTERVRATRQISEREAEFRALSERLSAALDVGGLGLWEIDLATRVTRWDARFAAMLGLPPAPIELSMEAGRPFFATEDEARTIAEFEQAVTSGQPYSSEFRARTVDGQTRWLLMRGSLSRQAGRGFGVARDVTDIRRREAALQAAVDARELLLREADHRIKNSLQLVVSMLTLARARLRDPEAASALSAAIARVHAVADAHLALQQSDDLRTIDVAAMLGDLCRRLATLNPDMVLVCAVNGPILMATDKAVPLGLILSEVVTNALRHAYPSGEPGRIEVTALVLDRVLEVRIEDFGRGLPEGGGRKGLGTRVITSLATQIGAAETTHSAPERGTSVTFRLRLEEALA